MIWGNFSCSDFGCSDFSCSDFGHFFIKIFAVLFNIHNLRTHLANIQMEWNWQNWTNLTKWNFYTLFPINIHILTKRIAQYPFLNFPSKWLFHPSLTHLKFYNIKNTFFFSWMIWPEEPQILLFLKSFLTHYPQPKFNPKSPKNLQLILIMTVKQVYTYFW